MRILFVTASPYLPQRRGGMKSSADELCVDLMRRGHQVAILAGFTHSNRSDWRLRLLMRINQVRYRCAVSRDLVSGYPVWRAWSPWNEIACVAAQERAELVVVMVGQPIRMGLAAQRTGLPILMLLQNVEFHTHGGRLADLGEVPWIANSRFTAEKYRTAYGIDSEVIIPYIAADRYRVATTRENVTFINPHPVKGRDLALEVARLCADIPFAFVEGWKLGDVDRRDLMQRLEALPNVTFLPPRDDMRSIYGKCKILLAPSVWEEAYGRVATEAQINGIPVVASSRGGLPEAVGAGGILLDPDRPAVEWAAAVRSLWQDQKHYDDLSAAALAHSERPETNATYQIESWERALRDAIERSCRQGARRASAS